MTGFHIPTSGDLPALVINKPSGNLTLAGTLRTTHNWTYTAVPGTFTTTGSTVVFAGGTITGSHTLEGVDIRGTVTLAAGTTLTATGSLNLFSGALNQAAATGTLAAQGNVDVQVGFTTGGTATLLLTGSANQTLTSYHTALVGDLPVVVINKPAGNLTLAPAGPGTGIIRTSHNWTFSAVGGTFTTTGATVVFTSGTVTGSHTLANVDIRGGTVTIAAGTTLNVGTYLNFVSGAIATGTLAAQGTVDIQLTAISTTSTATLLLNGAGNQTVTGYHTTLVGDLPPLAINKPSGNLTLAGTLRTGHNWTFTAVGGTFTTAGSTVVFTGGTISGSHTLTTVEIRGTVGIAVGTTLTASGYLNLFSGAVNLGTLEAQANVDVQSGFTGASTGTLLLDGAGNQTVTGFHIPTSGDLPALVINKPSGNLTLAGTLRTTHNWTYTAVPGTFTTTGSTVVFAGGTITGSHTLEGVDIRGTVTLAAGTTLTATGSLNLFSGALNQAAATGTLAAQGNVDVQVGFTTGGTATLLLTGSANQTLTSYHTALVGDLPVVVINKPAGNLTLAPAGPGTGIIRTSHNWTFSAVGGTFTTTGATVVFTSGTVTGSHTLANVDIRGGTVTIAAGTTLNVGTYLNFVSGAIATGTLAAQGTVDIQLTAISTTSTATLLLNGAGNQTVTGYHTTLVGDLPPLAINKPSGNLTLAGTLRTGHNWTFTAVGGTFTTAGSTVVFTGGTISGSHTLTTVEIRGTVGIAVGTTLTASGYLNLFSGAVNLGTLEAQANVDVQSGFTGASTGTLLLDGRGQPDRDRLPHPDQRRPAGPGHQQAERQPDPGRHPAHDPQLDLHRGPRHVHHDRQRGRLRGRHDHRLPHPRGGRHPGHGHPGGGHHPDRDRVPEPVQRGPQPGGRDGHPGRPGQRRRPGRVHDRRDGHPAPHRVGQPDPDQLPHRPGRRPAGGRHQQAGRQPDPGPRRAGHGHHPDEPQLDVQRGRRHVHHDRGHGRVHERHGDRQPHPGQRRHPGRDGDHRGRHDPQRGHLPELRERRDRDRHPGRPGHGRHPAHRDQHDEHRDPAPERGRQPDGDRLSHHPGRGPPPAGHQQAEWQPDPGRHPADRPQLDVHRGWRHVHHRGQHGRVHGRHDQRQPHPDHGRDPGHGRHRGRHHPDRERLPEPVQRGGQPGHPRGPGQRRRPVGLHRGLHRHPAPRRGGQPDRDRLPHPDQRRPAGPGHQQAERQPDPGRHPAHDPQLDVHRGPRHVHHRPAARSSSRAARSPAPTPSRASGSAVGR